MARVGAAAPQEEKNIFLIPHAPETTPQASKYIDFYSKRNFSFQQENEKIRVSSASFPKKMLPQFHSCEL